MASLKGGMPLVSCPFSFITIIGRSPRKGGCEEKNIVEGGSLRGKMGIFADQVQSQKSIHSDKTGENRGGDLGDERAPSL